MSGAAVRREDSEESSSAEDAPKLKDCRLETTSSSSPSRLRSSRITDYFARSPSPPPPVLVPQVPFDPVTMKPLTSSPQRQRREPAPPSSASSSHQEEDDAVNNDRASDRSEGDSGKENEEEFLPSGASTAVKRGSSASSTRSKLAQKQSVEPTRGMYYSIYVVPSSIYVLSQSAVLQSPHLVSVVTRSRSTSNKMPLLSLSSTRLNPPELKTPPASPSKKSASSPERRTPRSSPTRAAAAASSSADPKSPPTPHKIKLLVSEKAPVAAAAAALSKLKKISISPKTRTATTSADVSSSQESSTRQTEESAKGPKKK